MKRISIMSSVVQKNILFFQNSILPSAGGVPRVSDIIARELRNRGYNCYFVYYEIDNDQYPQQIKLKVDFRKNNKEFESSILKFVADNNVNIFVCQNAYSTPFIKVYKRIRSNYPLSSFTCFLHASPNYWQTYKIKSNTTADNLFQSFIKKTLKKIIYPFYNPYIKTTSALYNLCDKFVLLSESFKESFIKLYSINNSTNKLFTIPNPLTFDINLEQREINKKEKIVLIVSRLYEDQKKISTALKIWQQLPIDVINDWKLVVVGTGPDESFYRKYISANKLKNVKFVGQKTDVVKYYQQACIFLMTSVWEGFPMSLLEAQQNGVVPIVFDNFSAIHDIILEGENGYIIQDNDISLFTNKLSLLMQDEKLRYKMASKSIENSKRFEVSIIVDMWEKIISN